jgi:hypothetical protein
MLHDAVVGGVFLVAVEGKSEGSGPVEGDADKVF